MLQTEFCILSGFIDGIKIKPLLAGDTPSGPIRLGRGNTFLVLRTRKVFLRDQDSWVWCVAPHRKQDVLHVVLYCACCTPLRVNCIKESEKIFIHTHSYISRLLYIQCGRQMQTILNICCPRFIL